MAVVWIGFLALSATLSFTNAKPKDDSWRPRGYVPLSEKEKEHHPRFVPSKKRAIFVPPAAFDSAQKWPFCTSIRTIRDQGQCGSCWAVSGTSVIADRLCIARGKDMPELISATQGIGCTRPTFTAYQNCINGGNQADLFMQAALYGIPTGGLSGSSVGCVPYNTSSLTCATNCTNRAWSRLLPDDTTSNVIDSYWTDFANSASTESEIAANVLRMQEDIFNNGPLTASVFDITFNYSSAAPFDAPPPKDFSNGHAMRIIGWNVTTSGIRYWNISNSWGTSAGKNGYYWVRMGKNVGGIEQFVSAPVANLSKTISCNTSSFCSSPIDLALRLNVTDPASPIHLLQGECILEVNISNGKLTAVGTASPITSKIVGVPSSPINRYQLIQGQLWLINAVTTNAGVNCLKPPSAKKFACSGRGSTSNGYIVSAVYDPVSKALLTYLHDLSQPGWIFIFNSTTLDTMSGTYTYLQIPTSTTAVTYTTFVDIDGTKMYAFGKNTTSTGASIPVVGILAYPNATRNSFLWVTPPTAASTMMTC